MPPLTSDLVRVIQGSPPAIPNKCIACGIGSNDRRYVDTTLDIEEYGVVYFCEVCYLSAADKLGWSSPMVVNNLNTTIKSLEKQVGDVRQEVTHELYHSVVASGMFADYPEFCSSSVVELFPVDDPHPESTTRSKQNDAESSSKQGYRSLLDIAESQQSKSKHTE